MASSLHYDLGMKRIKAGDLARCGGELVTVLEVNGAWCTIKAFGNPVQYERQTNTVKKVA